MPAKHCLIFLFSCLLLVACSSLPQASTRSSVSSRAATAAPTSGRSVRSFARGGGATSVKKKEVAVSTATPFAWFKPGATRREKWLGFWLLAWNSIALTDALLFTFRPTQNLNGYLVGEWGPHTLAQTRMLANCQLGLVATVALVALTGNEAQIKNTFKILILCTLGAFRAIAKGVAEGTVKAPWKTGKALLMSAPPLLLLSHFAFIF